MFRKAFLFAIGGFALYQLMAPPRREQSSVGDSGTSGEPSITWGQIVPTAGDVPSETDYVTQTSPQSELIDFSGFVPTFDGSGLVPTQVRGQKTAQLWTPAINKSLSQVFQTRDSHPGTQQGALEFITEQAAEQEWVRNLRANAWPDYSMLNAWLIERGIVPIFLQGVPPLEWTQGRYAHSPRDLRALSEGVGVVLDPILFTTDPQVALTQGRILIAQDGSWWAVTQRGGKTVRERVPVAESWEFVPPVDSPQFLSNPRWLIKGDAQHTLLSPWVTINGQRVWRFPTEPAYATGMVRDYNRAHFYDWRQSG